MKEKSLERGAMQHPSNALPTTEGIPTQGDTSSPAHTDETKCSPREIATRIFEAFPKEYTRDADLAFLCAELIRMCATLSSRTVNPDIARIVGSLDSDEALQMIIAAIQASPAKVLRKIFERLKTQPGGVR